MAARNPTDFTRWIDKASLVAGKSILAAEIDSFVDDQKFVFDCAQLIISECFYRYGTTAAAYETLRDWFVDAKDVCSVASFAGVVSCQAWALGWNSNGTTSGNIRIQGITAGTSTNAAWALGVTTPTWQSLGTLNLSSDGTEEDIRLDLYRTAGAGTFYCAGLLVVALET